ncbi:MAG: glycosyl hydrolase family 18 protein [Candidatus Kaiserbacteria bacterium]|nr:glycosyl hydrolase family 18 protein [Candidatus Kaiserbacteria bacterium]
MKLRIYIILTLLCVIGVPANTYANDTALEVSGWIPYWRDSEGIKDAKKHIKNIDIVYPFAFTVTTKGELRDQAGLGDREWKNFVKLAHKNNTLVVPTVMWAEGNHIHEVLSSTALRAEHIDGIVSMVEKGNYDGVDIDYESKESKTIDYFSLFLKELKKELGKKLLTCTIEARTPPESLYKEVPAFINYANDYSEIAKHCDRIEIMAYDQQRADIKLNAEKAGEPYMPVSDVDWVRKVVELALEDIPKEKIMLGISSYGHHYAVTVAPNWYRDYRKIGALNVPDILDVAKENKVTPSRNKSGEMSFTYLPKSSKVKLSKSLKIPKNTPKGNIISARALAHADKTGEEVTFNMAWYGDAESMKQKIDLAKEYNLRGVALFKIDGEEDQKVWKYLP